MEQTLQIVNPVALALFAGCFNLLLTGVGSAFVFLTKRFNQKMFDTMLGFAAGIMIAASFWSLLAPAIEISRSSQSSLSIFKPAIGFLLGAIVFRLIDWLLPHLHLGFSIESAEGIKTSWHRNILHILAITIHNIPEGLSVGVAIGSSTPGFSGVTLAGAMALTFGIGLHNIPEGLVVSISLVREKIPRLKSFWLGMLSGIFEPIFAVLGAIAVLWAHYLLPYALGFAAGAMIFVVVEEVIPESQHNGNVEYATGGTIFGFLTMMVLEIALG